MAKKAKQGVLSGMEEETIQELDEAAEVYYDAMQERVKHTKEETEARESLIEKMKEHRKKIYKSPHGWEVAITDKASVKVKKKGEEAENDE